MTTPLSPGVRRRAKERSILDCVRSTGGIVPSRGREAAWNCRDYILTWPRDKGKIVIVILHFEGIIAHSLAVQPAMAFISSIIWEIVLILYTADNVLLKEKPLKFYDFRGP